MPSNEISEQLQKLFNVYDPHNDSGREALIQLMREREEAAYVAGAEMARKLLRLHLGLSTKEDRQ